VNQYNELDHRANRTLTVVVEHDATVRQCLSPFQKVHILRDKYALLAYGERQLFQIIGRA